LKAQGKGSRRYLGLREHLIPYCERAIVHAHNPVGHLLGEATAANLRLAAKPEIERKVQRRMRIAAICKPRMKRPGRRWSYGFIVKTAEIASVDGFEEGTS
jgi:hypothetical protein